MSAPKLIVMLTHNDRTVENAREIFAKCKDVACDFWGFKEVGLPLDQMKILVQEMHDAGKTVFLEVVAYTEDECLDGAKVAVECGFDCLMGTLFFDSVNDYCKANNLEYMPFVGKITGRPSVLEGTIEGMIDEANSLIAKGVAGFDLLGYRYTGDAVELNKKFVAGVDIKVCLAGSISSYKRLDEVCDAAPWAFTIGGAFFENKFDGTFGEQIEKVVNYVEATYKG